MFCLEIEYLNGISFAASPSDHSSAEFPPHPDRVFQALVSVKLNDNSEDDALRWLESQDPPSMVFSKCTLSPLIWKFCAHIFKCRKKCLS